MSTSVRSSHPDAPDVSAQIARLMRLVGRVKTHAATRTLTGLEWSAYSLLFHLVKDGPLRSTALAQHTRSDPSTVSRQTAALVERGLVERRPDPADRRAALLAATPAGSELFSTMRSHRDAMFGSVLADWSPQDVERLSTLLLRFNDDFDAHISEVLDMTHPDPPDPAHTAEPAPSPLLQESS